MVLLRSLHRSTGLCTRLCKLKSSSRLYCAGLADNADSADVVISGGGMVGGAMAAALGHCDHFSNKKIILLEASPQREFRLQEKYSNRTCALSPATVSLLKSFGAWDEIVQMRCQAVKRMQVWESCSNSMITFNNEDMDEGLAFIVENDVIQAAIYRRLAEANVEIRYQTNATQYLLPGDVDIAERKPWVQVQTEDGSAINTQLLLGADGFKSTLRTQAKIHTVQWDYKQTAVVATLELSDDSPDNHVAWQRFLPTGPIALLPLSHNVSSLVWTTSPERADHLKKMSPESFVDAVNDALWHERDKNNLADTALDALMNLTNNFLPGSSPCRQLPPTVTDVQENSRASFPLSLTHASQYVKPRVALIGDAAHRIHPLAGQGVNLGFGDVSCLVELLQKAVQNGSDLGSLNHLLEYETQRQREVLPVVATIDGLQRLYSTTFTPLVVLRSLGLHITNSLDVVKKQIIQRASASSSK